MADENNFSESAVPAVDLVPEPAPAPIPPSAPPTLPQFNAVSKAALKQGQPVTQETHVTQTVYPGASRGVTAGMLDTPGAPKKSMACIQYMASLSQDPNCTAFQIEVSRTGPAVFQGQRFPFGVIERFPPAPYVDIYEQIRQVHGGGAYRIRILNEEGAPVHQMVFNIDTLANPPILSVPGNGSGSFASGGMRGAAAFATVGGEQDDVQKYRNEAARLRAEEEKLVTEHRVHQTRRNIERQQRLEVEAEERRNGAPQAEAQRTADQLRNELREVQHQSDIKMNTLNSNFEKLMLLLANKKDDSGFEKMMMMFVEMNKAAQAQQTQLLTAMMANNNKSDWPSILQMQNESNKQIVQMATQSATAGSAKSERLLEQLIINKIEHPDNAIRQALEMRESGRKEAIEMWQMLEEARGGNSDDRDVIDPESGFWGNAGNLILHGIKSLVSGASRGGGMKAMELLSGILQKPAGTTQFSEADLQLAADRIAQARQNPQLSAPMQRPALPAPAAAPQRRTSIKLFDRIYETESAPPLESLAPLMPDAMMQQQQQMPGLVEIEESEAHADTSTEASSEVLEAEAEVTANEPADYVTEAVSLAIADIRAGRREHDWVDFALGKWNRDFLQELVKLPDDQQRIALIQQKTDPAVFNELVALLTDAQKPQNYRDFVENFKALLEEASAEVASVAAA